MNERTRPTLTDLRREPTEWHRRGLSHPDEINAMISRRTADSTPAEPTYADFFVVS